MAELRCAVDLRGRNRRESGPTTIRALALLGSVLFLCGSCTSGPAGPEVASLEFSSPQLDLGTLGAGSITLRNTGNVTLGPIDLVAGTVRDQGGGTASAARLDLASTQITALTPGREASIDLTLFLPASLQPGEYDVSLLARAGDAASTLLDVRAEVAEATGVTGPFEVSITPVNQTIRQGDVVTFAVEVRDGAGSVVGGVPISWSTDPVDAGAFGANGQFVASMVGSVDVVASTGVDADTVAVSVDARDLVGTLDVLGQTNDTTRFTNGLWIHGDYAYTGTTLLRYELGNTMYTWSLADPANPVLSDSIVVPATRVNDVKVRADGQIGILTQEGQRDGENGVTLIDLSDPGHPTVITTVTNGLEAGVHNAWIEGNYAYLAVNAVCCGPDGGSVSVLDISEPENPEIVASYHAGESLVHDVEVKDGLAFVSHWDVGLVIVDVGNGIAGGSPTSPVEVSRIQTAGGQTHNALYWPEAGYVFVGEEDEFNGVMHVVDVRNLARPREVATFGITNEGPHNFWLDADNEVLYASWFSKGVRAIDVSGELMGELDRQGREIASVEFVSSSYDPQLHRGLVYATVKTIGLVVLQPNF